MIYAISDIHGCLDELKENMKKIDLPGNNILVFLGDYIDYGEYSGQVLRYIYDLQKEYGDDKIVVLKGNHEADLLDWIDEYKQISVSEFDSLLSFNPWLKNDAESGYKTFKTLISDAAFDRFRKEVESMSFDRMNRRAVQILLAENHDLIAWIRKMPLYYETKDMIFVHAGINEKAGKNWKAATGEEVFLAKYPPTTGKFIKTIVAGHTGTSSEFLSNDSENHDIYFDGQSHYYIDGTVYRPGGRLNVVLFENESFQKCLKKI